MNKIITAFVLCVVFASPIFGKRLSYRGEIFAKITGNNNTILLNRNQIEFVKKLTDEQFAALKAETDHQVKLDAVDSLLVTEEEVSMLGKIGDSLDAVRELTDEEIAAVFAGIFIIKYLKGH